MKITRTIAVVMMIWMAALSVMGAEDWYTASKSGNGHGLKWEEVAGKVKSAKDACNYVRRHVRYRIDLGEGLMSAERTWNLGYGDCEDFAGCVVALCAGIGIQAEIVVLHPKDSYEGHAIAMGKTEEGIWISSNGNYREVDSLEAAKRSVAREMGWLRKEIVVTTLEEATGGRVAGVKR